MTSRTGKIEKGFLLLEVMVSVAILSIALVMILGSFTRSIRTIELSEDYFRAGLLLENKIYELSHSEIEEGSSSGVFSDFDNRFSWNLEIMKMEEGLVRELNLGVSWHQGAKEHDLSIVTYLYAT